MSWPDKILPQIVKAEVHETTIGECVIRKLVSVTFFALLLIGLLSPTLKAQLLVEGVSSVYEGNLMKAALFLNFTQFDPLVGLCRIVPEGSNYSLLSDNLLAYHALGQYYPETADTIYATMLGYGYFRSFKHEVLFGTTIPYIPFRTPNEYVIAQIESDLIKTEVCNGTLMNDYTGYADLCIYAALDSAWDGNIPQAIGYFNIARNMWNSTLHGIYDNASRIAEKEGERLIFSTYKLSLLLYCSRILGQPLDDGAGIEETLWLMQDDAYGGLHTDYDVNLNYMGSNMNTETTSLAILAYKYEPKIVNRPVQCPLSLNIPPDYPTIQEAINAASDGDTVFVRNGTYFENLNVSKSLTLQGENKYTTIIDGSQTGIVVDMTTSNSSISGFTIRNGEWYYYLGPSFGASILINGTRDNVVKDNILSGSGNGISIQDSNDSKIEENIVAQNIGGIYLYDSDNVVVANNTVASNNIGGIYLEYSSDNIVYNNTILNNGMGITLADSSGNTLTYNNMTGNNANLDINPDYVNDFSNHIDTSNTVNGKPVYCLVNQHNMQVPADAGYVAAINSTNIIVKDLNLMYNSPGVLFAYTTNSIIMNVNCSHNSLGIYLFSSNNNTVVKSISNNCEEGIDLRYSNDNFIVGNTISYNSAFSFGSLFSFNNRVFHNNFVNNARAVVMNSLIAWDNGYPSGGNCWSDYSGSDVKSGPHQNESGSDGIGDTPYTIDASNLDNYPLMKSWHPIQGDIDYDGKVSRSDLVLLANAHGSKSGDTKWNPNADINNDGKVSLADLVLMAIHYGQHYP